MQIKIYTYITSSHRNCDILDILNRKNHNDMWTWLPWSDLISKYIFVITISQIIMIIFGEIADWNLWVIKLTSSLRFSISISGSQIVFVDILQVQMSHRITDIYLAHQCDVIWHIHQWLGRTICQTARWELTQHVTF